jgi:hypothetical protein
MKRISRHCPKGHGDMHRTHNKATKECHQTWSTSYGCIARNKEPTARFGVPKLMELKRDRVRRQLS